MGRTACFIGHRKIKDKLTIKPIIKNAIINLIINDNIDSFIFGSRSEFDGICHEIVTDLQNTKYPNISRIIYTCSHEFAVLKKDKKRIEDIHYKLYKTKVVYQDYDKEYDFPAKYLAGKSSYIQRNKTMIDNSDICIFYYDENYIAKNNSGTKIAYNYAIKKNKRIINIHK